MNRTYQINEYTVARLARRRQRLGMVAMGATLVLASFAWAIRPMVQ